MNRKEQAYYEIKFRGKSMAKIPLKSGQPFDEGHLYFQKTNKFYNTNKSLVIFYLLDEYCTGINNTKRQWKRDKKPYHCIFTNKDKSKWKSKDFNYFELDKYIRRKNKFTFSDFKFPKGGSDWLDISVDMSINFHLPAGKNGMIIQDYSLKNSGIDIVPQLDREGHLISSFLPQLTMRVVNRRNKLIETSNNALNIEWLFEFKDLINDCISLIDIFLMQFYNKAKFNPLPSWNFDEDKVGTKYGRRLNDKINWVFQITGKNLNIEKERIALKTLRELRNHINHFDPPSFCASLEEISEWLNMTLQISTILYKMRKCANAKMSEELLTFMIQPIVEFEPQAVFNKRVKQDKNRFGYNTSIWR